MFLLLSWLTSLGGIYWEEMHRDDRSGGIAIKITKTADGLYSGAPQQVFAYNLEGSQVWYDLSSVFGEPFIGHRVEVASDTGEAIVSNVPVRKACEAHTDIVHRLLGMAYRLKSWGKPRPVGFERG
jgi:hypothetical protein